MEVITEYLSPALTWFIIGIIMILIELALPSLIFMFFGIGAWCVSLLCFNGSINSSISTQIILFSIISVVSLIFLRNKMKELFHGKESNNSVEIDDDFVGKKVDVVENITLQKDGKVSLHGTNWKARSMDDLKKGDTAVVVKKENITLIVEKII